MKANMQSPKGFDKKIEQHYKRGGVALSSQAVSSRKLQNRFRAKTKNTNKKGN